MIQHKVTFTKNSDGTIPPPVCGDGVPPTITLRYGVPKLNGYVIEKIFVYYSEQTTGDFMLDCEDETGDAFVRLADVKVTPQLAPIEVWPSQGGFRWERNATGHLLLHFTPPEHPLFGAAHDWTFNAYTPPVVLKIKIKRQDEAFTAATACADWPA
jgi:hypothetical protein